MKAPKPTPSFGPGSSVPWLVTLPAKVPVPATVVPGNTVMTGDNAPSDKLVIDGGAATGSTGLRVVNRGGLGAPTLADGILVVQAVNGGTTADHAFSLTQAVEAGA